MVLASASGMARIATSTSKVSSIRPCAVRLPVPKSSASGVSSTAPPRTVTVAGAVSVAAIARLAQRQAGERRGEAVRRAGRARPRRRRGCRSPAGSRREAHAVAVDLLGLGGERGDVDAADGEVGGGQRALHHRQAERVGDPGVGVERADARWRRRRGRGRWRRGVTPWPTSAASRVMSASSAPVASTSASAATGAMSGASSVSRPVAGASPVLASDAGQPVRADGDDEAVDRRRSPVDRDVAGEVEHQPVERRPSRRGCR